MFSSSDTEVKEEPADDENDEDHVRTLHIFDF